MKDRREEHDLLGAMQLPADSLYGIHTARALDNFPLSGHPVHRELVHAYGAVKLACARANLEYAGWNEKKAQAIFAACREMIEGGLDSHIVVDALQGGAGTSTNMNVNEVLANRALILLGRKAGEYDVVSPLDDLNLHQSTNDTYPTALRVAAITLLRQLEKEVLALLEAFQALEKKYAGVVKVGRTQTQDAVLTTAGREMGAYAEALGRDRWRIYKCEERLRVVNLGGTAIGTGVLAPRGYIFAVVDILKEITGFGLSRAENLVEATQNADVFVEVSGILKALAVTLVKISGDLRFLSSGPDAGIGEVRLPARQAGSSIMPGKVNPVIPEAVTQSAFMVMAQDQAITQAVFSGHLELNPFLPLVAECLLSSLSLLAGACRIFREHCVAGLEVDSDRCRSQVENSTAAATALVAALGYELAGEVAAQATREKKSLRSIVLERGLITEQEFDRLIAPESVTRLGTPEKRGKG